MNESPEATSPASIAATVAAIRERLRMIDEIDRGTADMVERLAEAVRSSAEVRAQASLDIAAAIDRLERSISARDAAQRAAMLALQQEVAVAHTRALGVGEALTGLELELAGLQARLSEDESTPVTPQPDGEPPASPNPMQPLPAATTHFIEVEQIPTAGAALSIQRFVAELPGVVAATTREYAAGLLRLEVRTRGAFDPANLLGWPGGKLELVEQDERALLYRLAG
jgi:hypothetical protein